MLGIASRSAASRSHGSSARKRSATSYVAPPQHSTDHSSGVVRETCSATASRSRERTRVASSDWWASRKVVSVTATRSWARSRRANSSGPTSRSSWRVPSGTGCDRSSDGSLLDGVTETRASPCGWLTVTSAR